MEERVLAVVCLLIAVSALAGVLYQTGDVPTDETVTRLDIDAEGDAVCVLEARRCGRRDGAREERDRRRQR
ncbi:MAG: hypothetical protein U5J64_05910 [Halobacteriales archaeon]|nr:hypothetical protein [Halobacteriales archaeon]